MRKNIVKNIIIHVTDDTDFYAIADKVNEFHVEIIERRLNDSNLAKEYKIAIIDKIIENIKSRDVEGIIS